MTQVFQILWQNGHSRGKCHKITILAEDTPFSHKKNKTKDECSQKNAYISIYSKLAYRHSFLVTSTNHKKVSDT